MPLLEWFANNYKTFGATLEIVTDKSQEGSQFVKGFGGIGGKCSLQITFCREIERYCHISIFFLFFFFLQESCGTGWISKAWITREKMMSSLI